jgi:flagellar biosynthesis protein FlhG
MPEDSETAESAKKIWAVGGGKGGTGKSLLASSMGIQLARQGHRVLLVDADLGCANLHTCLGIEYPSATLSDFLHRRVRNLSDILVQTEIPQLEFISGAKDFLEIANPKSAQKMRLIRKIQELNHDIVLVDLGGGTHFNTLDLFLISESGLVVVLPEPTSIENAYRFIKSAFYRRFKQVIRKSADADGRLRNLIAEAMNQKNDLGIKTPHDLIEQIALLDPETGDRLRAQMERLRPKIVVNQVRSRDDITLGFSMRSACSKYFGISVEYLGYLEYDDSVWQATRRRRPLLLEYPDSRAEQGIRKVVSNLLRREQLTLDGLLHSLSAIPTVS